MKNRNTWAAFLIGLAVIAFMIQTEQAWQPAYFIKSLVKLAVFAGAVFLYMFISREILTDVLHITRNPVSKKLILFMIGVYLFVVAGFFLLKGQLDPDRIRESLFAKEHLTRQNFLFVFAYIIVVNSFLEEAFFRGFLFHALKPAGKGFAYTVSSALFAVYHIGIVANWFQPLIFVLCIAGLLGAGIFLQYIEQKNDNLLASWIVHASANLAINTIGTFLILSK